ncbi:hypothetical protein [Tenacibaculum jejuense]|uniref:Probable lipoprotein n=1 Tax=Tenacibaculum jejuense TaxID=584609 RepID=A0A238U8F1_9FLAO|nr:hypothetical protein [Tenacibaculum jejuense]SNR15469.1 Probable lipoprotein precursor [Tenacibaculum jejuense]
MGNKVYASGIIFMILTFFVSCSDEITVDDRENSDVVINEYQLSDLPDNVEDLKDIIARQQKELGIKPKLNQMFNEGSSSYVFDFSADSFRKIFIVYPKDWTPIDYFRFIQTMFAKYGYGIKSEPNNCDHIETWYIPIQSRFDPINPTGDRSKNLIVASNSGVNGNTKDEDEDGPQLPTPTVPIQADYYNSCEEILIQQ